MPVDAVPFGDRAWLVTLDDLAATHRLAGGIEAAVAEGRAPAGTREATVGMSTVVVHLDAPVPASPERRVTGDADAESWLSWLSDVDPATSRARRPASKASDPVEVPTVFDGPDLGEVAGLAGTDEHGVIELLCRAELQVAFIGFSPGFPYLVGLPGALAAIGRRSTPRTAVPAGSVALAGGFAGIYPQATPGGWWVVGRTSLRLFDPKSPPFARLRAGDRVRLAAASPAKVRGRPSSSAPGGRRTLTTRARRAVEVVDPGLFTTVQDSGRTGGAALGVPPAGPCDPDAMRLANRLVGNDDDDAVLEITASGPRLLFGAPAHVAVVGAGPEAVAVSIDGRPATDAAPVPVEGGQVLAVDRVVAGLRAYLAVTGGFLVPAVVGSRSSDVLCGLGPGALRAGDRLALGPPGRPRGSLVPKARTERNTVRAIAGPHPFPPDAVEALVATPWTVSASSSRIGIRLESVSRRLPPGPNILSTGMVTGAVQVPPSGSPIVLMPDHATVGGYPVVATVIGADLGVLGQLSPGDTLRFTLVDRAAAAAAAWRHENALSARVQGWYPTKPAT